MSEMFPHNPLKFDARGLSADEQRDLYAKLLLPRMIEEKMMWMDGGVMLKYK